MSVILDAIGQHLQRIDGDRVRIQSLADPETDNCEDGSGRSYDEDR